MPEERAVLGVVRFGRFELSADTGELRKDGARLKLAGQAIQVLAMLAANPGKLVTREELQQRLWPGASFGDPEHGLNAAVNKLRETLGDSATDPKYIETVPGRGYRFIATLDLHGNGAEPPQPPKPPWWKRKATIAIAACVVGAGSLYPWTAPRIERLWRLYELQKLTVIPLTALEGFLSLAQLLSRWYPGRVCMGQTDRLGRERAVRESDRYEQSLASDTSRLCWTCGMVAGWPKHSLWALYR